MVLNYSNLRRFPTISNPAFIFSCETLVATWNRFNCMNLMESIGHLGGPETKLVYLGSKGTASGKSAWLTLIIERCRLTFSFVITGGGDSMSPPGSEDPSEISMTGFMLN